MDPLLSELKKELAEAKQKLSAYNKWIIENTQHPDFFKIVSDRNYWTVKLDGIEKKIGFVEQGKPMLGEPEELQQEVRLIINYQSGKINI